MSVNQSVAGSLQKCFPQRSTRQDTTREGRGHGESSSLSEEYIFSWSFHCKICLNSSISNLKYFCLISQLITLQIVINLGRFIKLNVICNNPWLFFNRIITIVFWIKSFKIVNEKALNSLPSCDFIYISLWLFSSRNAFFINF